jgi:DNA-binding beta-propeller fold protein YncE
MTRRDLLRAIPLLIASARLRAASSVSTVIGTGTPGHSDREVANPYGIVVGPDGALYFCDLDNQRVRRLDRQSGRTTDVAGNGVRGHDGDGGPATAASLNMPHEIQFDARGNFYIAERDSHVVRKVDARTGIIATLAGTGVAGFSGDGGPADRAQLRQPHSIAIDAADHLLICDIGNQRIRRIDLATGIIDTYAGTGVAQPTPDGAALTGTPLNGPRTFAFAPDGSLYLALREGNAIYRIDTRTSTLHHIAGTGKQGWSGDDGPARSAELGGPKGLAFDAPRNALYVADTETHVIRRIDTKSGIITTVLGTGQRGDGPDGDPRQCRLSRPHGLFVDRSGLLYVTDSEAHRIRVLKID